MIISFFFGFIFSRRAEIKINNGANEKLDKKIAEKGEKEIKKSRGILAFKKNKMVVKQADMGKILGIGNPNQKKRTLNQGSFRYVPLSQKCTRASLTQ